MVFADFCALQEVSGFDLEQLGLIAEALFSLLKAWDEAMVPNKYDKARAAKKRVPSLPALVAIKATTLFDRWLDHMLVKPRLYPLEEVLLSGLRHLLDQVTAIGPYRPLAPAPARTASH